MDILRVNRSTVTFTLALLVFTFALSACGGAAAPQPVASAPASAAVNTVPPAGAPGATLQPTSGKPAESTPAAATVVPAGKPGGTAAAATVVPAGKPGSTTAAATAVPAGKPAATTVALKCSGQDAPAAAAPATVAPAASLTAAETAYLDQVDALAARMNNASELTAATLAMRDATQQYGLTGTIDAAAATRALDPAVSFMASAGADVSALTPPPGFKGVQDELQGAVNDENKFLKDSQAAVANPSRDAVSTVQLQLLNPFGNLLVVTLDSNNRRTKGGMGLPQVGVDSPLVPAETAYLNQVQVLVNRMSGCPALGDAASAFGDDLEKLNNTGQLDGKSSEAARLAATRFMNTVAQDAQALQPPARLQSVQVELLRVVQLYQSGLNDWQTAIAAQNWDSLTNAFFAEMGAGGATLSVLNKDLAFLGIK